ncbi:MAG: class I SAM-dependent methyltransferase [Dehalococcoidia bacterium]|nr:class I SAM-dependent methyltransferase [Dehalococcoidia bacterium]
MQRKRKEQEFHDSKIDKSEPSARIQVFESRFYAAARKSKRFLYQRVFQSCQKKRLLDYCCGTGGIACSAAASNAETTIAAIDISQASVIAGRERAINSQIGGNIGFAVMDAENLGFRSRSFNVIACVSGLHHLDIERAYSEIARVLKSDGEAVCIEPLAYNPLIQLYRRITPHSRTAWETEHILTRTSTVLARKYFVTVQTRFFHLATLAAAPFYNFPGFNALLSILEFVDEFLLRLPVLKWGAWQIALVLSQPEPPGNEKA